jgi:TPR repeat protein
MLSIRRSLMLVPLLSLCTGTAFASSCDPKEADVADVRIMQHREAKCAEKTLQQAEASAREALQLENRGEGDRMCRVLHLALMQLEKYRQGEWRDGYGKIARKVDEDFADRLARFEKTPCPQKIQIYHHLAGKGDAWAMFRLGSSHAKGAGVPQDDSAALTWFQLAAEQGYPAAYMALGMMFSEGKAFAPDYGAAFDWFTKAAALNDAEAQFQLGGLYRKGLGVEKNASQAVEWYRKAAGQGHEGAKVRLNEMYRSGEARKPLYGY